MLTPVEFYRDIDVVRRILEYCGVSDTDGLRIGEGALKENEALSSMAEAMTAEYVAGEGDQLLRTRGKRQSSRYPSQLGELLDAGLNISRSVWDRQSITFFFDVEYCSDKYKGETYANPQQVFRKLEPVYRCIWDSFREFGITPMTIATGQGYHFVFKVDSYKDDEVTLPAKELVRLGFLEDTVKGKYEHLPWHTKRRRIVEPELGKAYDSVGKLLEFVVHRVLQRVGEYGARIPVSIGDITAGNEKKEMINLDLSSYADPLFTRCMRTAFSIHDKNKKNPEMWIRDLPVAVSLPRYTPCNGNELSLEEIFSNRRHFRNSANYASAITCTIPECSEGVMQLIRSYEASGLHKFHKDFDNRPQDDPRDWHRTYDAINTRELPPCVVRALSKPNPALLQPTQIQTLVRVLTGREWWHPIHVAGLIRSKYERDHGWDFNWGKYDANRHAKVWVRMYAGLLAMGIDQRTDQNCISHQEKGLCPNEGCGYDLGSYR